MSTQDHALWDNSDLEHIFVTRFGQESWDHHTNSHAGLGRWFQSECANIKRDLAAVAPAIAARVLRQAADDLYGDLGPGNPLSTMTWLRDRAAALGVTDE